MKLGPAYAHRPEMEFFLRTMPYGTFPLQQIRDRYACFTETKFVAILRHLSYRRVLSLDGKKKTISFPKKMYALIHFLGATDFLQQMKDHPLATNDRPFDSRLTPFLRKAKFNEYRLSNPGQLNPMLVLNLCLKAHYGSSFLEEIGALGIFKGGSRP